FGSRLCHRHCSYRQPPQRRRRSRSRRHRRHPAPPLPLEYGSKEEGRTVKQILHPNGEELLVVVGGSYFENGEEGFLRDVHLADALHAALAFFLFFEEFAFAGNVATVALG